jgi:16S rRNA (uracil1498-N3)-methyltransferase
VLPPVFYAPPECREGEIINLPALEAKHAARVLRLKRGAIIVIVDGLGNACRAELTAVSIKAVTARAHSEIREMGEPSVRLTLAAGLSTGMKFDSVVQRGTELGVSRFIPLLTEKSLVAIEDSVRARTKLSRWRNVSIAAMKQCRRSRIPDVSAPTPFRKFLQQFDRADTGIIFHPGQNAVSSDSLMPAKGLKRITLAVGPESGFDDEEVAAAVQAGFVCVSLGQRILRTETAGPVAVALVIAKLGEFR